MFSVVKRNNRFFLKVKTPTENSFEIPFKPGTPFVSRILDQLLAYQPENNSPQAMMREACAEFCDVEAVKHNKIAEQCVGDQLVLIHKKMSEVLKDTATQIRNLPLVK